MVFASPRRRSAGFLALSTTLGSLALFAGACSSSNDASSVTTNDASVTDSAPSGTIAFDAGSTLSAAPESTVTVDVTTSADEAITFWLDGAYADASLAASTAVASGGKASVVLRTTSAASSFSLHAKTAGGAEATLAISVNTGKFVTLDVHYDYKGSRTVGPVVASIFVDTTCMSIKGQPISDGTLVTTGAPGMTESSLTIASVPAGVAVAVVGRIGHYAWDCADLASSLDVQLDIADIPLVFDHTDVSIDFTPEPTAGESASWTTMLDPGRLDADDAFLAGESEPDALLDAMAAAAGGQMSSFTAARQNDGWNAATTTWLSAHPALVHDQIDKWMSAAEARALGDLVFHLSPATKTSATSTTTTWAAPTSLASFDNLGPSITGLSVLVPFNWTVASSVSASGTLQYNVSLAGSLALAQSELITSLTASPDGALSVPAGLANGIDCAGLGQTLASAGTYAGCDDTCLGSLCEAALGAMWTRAEKASASSTTANPIDITLNTVNGTAAFDDNASVVEFSGAWSGATSETIKVKDTSTTLAGTLHGTFATSATSR